MRMYMYSSRQLGHPSNRPFFEHGLVTWLLAGNKIRVKYIVSESANMKDVGMQVCGDVVISQHRRSMHEAVPHSYLWCKGDSQFSFLFLSSPRNT